MPQKMDPKLAALIKAHPDYRPDELYAYLYGSRRADVALPPSRSLGDLARSLSPFAPVVRALKR